MSGWWERRLSQEAPPPPAPMRPSVGHILPGGSPAPPPMKPQPKPEDLCPNCTSENYLSATPNTRKRCYDCGYPTIQAGSGLGRSDASVAKKRAVQVSSPGYSPTTIIGRVE